MPCVVMDFPCHPVCVQQPQLLQLTFVFCGEASYLPLDQPLLVAQSEASLFVSRWVALKTIADGSNLDAEVLRLLYLVFREKGGRSGRP